MTRFMQYEMTASQWASQNVVLLKGEVGWESGNPPKAKKGDGTTAWNDLPYAVTPAAPLNSPTFTGDPKAPTPLPSDNDTSIATTAFVKAQGYAPAASPTFTGNPAAPTPATADNDTSIATTAFVKAQGYAPAASPTFTGNPAGPTPATTDNDTSLATTAFVKAVLLAAHPIGDIKMSVVNVNPSTYIGGTWVAWGSGRVPVGVDTGQTEFDTVEETNSSASKTVTIAIVNMPSHDHGGVTGGMSTSGIVSTAAVATSVATSPRPLVRGGGSDYADVTASSLNHTHSIPVQGGGTPINNLQPYITCYMFKRTA